MVGMGRDVAAAFPVAADVYARADKLLGYPLSKLCFDGPAERLNATDIQQPAIFVTSVAIFHAAAEQGLIAVDGFAAMGGLSLGEYTSLHLAGALSFEDALHVVHRRGQLMQQAAVEHSGGMVSLIGMDETQALALCERAAEHGRVRPANFNCPGQIVISGEQGGCDAAVRFAGEFGGKAIPLKVAGAFHSDLMRSAADGLRPALAQCGLKRPRVPVVANVDATYHGDPDAIRDSLYRQVFNPVRWARCVERLIRDGCTHFWEIGPNRVLAGLLRKIDRSVESTNIGTAAELKRSETGVSV
jgi:[acyl-carrier-protein] S-malonyltransferase